MFKANSIWRLTKRSGGVRFVVLALLLTASLCLAQPQAPIVWGEARLLMNAPQGIMVTNGVFAHGDTIVLAGDWRYGTRKLATVCVSGDNGQSFSPWYTFPTADSLDSYITFAVTGSGLYCCAPVDHQPQRRIFRSTDLGQSWQGLSVAIPYLRFMETRGDTMWCASWNWSADTLRWTVDGESFSPTIGIDLGTSHIDDFSVSDSAIALTSYTEFPEFPFSTAYVVTARRPNGPFIPTRLNPFCECTLPADIEFDQSGIGLINSSARYTGPCVGLGASFLTQTSDHGSTWLSSDTLEPTETGGAPLLRHLERRWIAAWIDTLVSPPFNDWGAWFRFSANNGRSWYPARQAFGENMSEGDLRPLDFSGNRVRIYESCLQWNGVPGRYYLQWEGQIQRDSLSPVVTSAFTLPEILPADTTVLFAATASDNDSLWQMNVVIKHPGQPDSLVLPLIRQADNNFSAAWQVPEDSNVFLYSYRAEDMWEHVTSYPDSGWLSFFTETDEANPYSLLPTSLRLSAYPNPFNPTTTIIFSLPLTGEVKVEIFDITGKLVQQLSDSRMTAGEHEIRLNGANLASGIYFVRMQTAQRSRIQKLVLMK